MLDILKKEKLFEGKFATMWGTFFTARNGSQRVWEWIEKKDIVYVLPLTKNGKAVLIRSFRIPIENYVIETPAGLVDDKTLSYEEIAKKELLEETGYVFDKIISLPPSPNSSGITNGLVYGFIATGCIKNSNLNLEEAEDIEVLEIDVNKLVDYLLNLPTGELYDQRILSAYQIALKKNLIP